MNRFSDTFQTVTNRSLFGPNVPYGISALTRWLTNSGCVAQALSSLVHSSTVRQTIMRAMSEQLLSNLCAVGTTDPPQHRLFLPKLDMLAVDADEEPPKEWEAEDYVKCGPVDPCEVKIARQKDIKYWWDMQVHMYPIVAESRTRTGRNPSWPQVGRYKQRKRQSPTLPIAIGVHEGAPPRGRTDVFGNTSAGNSASSTLCCVSGRRLSSCCVSGRRLSS